MFGGLWGFLFFVLFNIFFCQERRRREEGIYLDALIDSAGFCRILQDSQEMIWKDCLVCHGIGFCCCRCSSWDAGDCCGSFVPPPCHYFHPSPSGNPANTNTHTHTPPSQPQNGRRERKPGEEQTARSKAYRQTLTSCTRSRSRRSRSSRNRSSRIISRDQLVMKVKQMKNGVGYILFYWCHIFVWSDI